MTMFNSSSVDRWLTFVGRQAFCRWTDVQKKRRIYLITLPDGFFTLWTGHFSDDALEMSWIDDTQGASYYDSEQTAIADIHARFPWSRDVAPEFPPHD
ncbi:MAG: hypothetical protein ACM3JB_13350 [Acidobacteriaceae bacterium]